MGKLYVVSTPIGNLGDITLRALRILKKVDLILCEDTRVTRKLLNAYGINTSTESYHSQSKVSKETKIVSLLESGKDLALVSDAGTPSISDPGVKLISNLYSKGFRSIFSVPGASSLTSALSICPIIFSDFVFIGFLPHKKGRETLIKEMIDSKRASVFFESPHRILKTLNLLMKHDKERKIFVARELTKMYEETFYGSIEETIEFFESSKEKQKGEFVVVLSKK
jgi:16S rRNA (cytidine1402-2'-O)-methyltransferase